MSETGIRIRETVTLKKAFRLDFLLVQRAETLYNKDRKRVIGVFEIRIGKAILYITSHLSAILQRQDRENPGTAWLFIGVKEPEDKKRPF